MYEKRKAMLLSVYEVIFSFLLRASHTFRLKMFFVAVAFIVIVAVCVCVCVCFNNFQLDFDRAANQVRFIDMVQVSAITIRL